MSRREEESWDSLEGTENVFLAGVAEGFEVSLFEQ